MKQLLLILFFCQLICVQFGFGKTRIPNFENIYSPIFFQIKDTIVFEVVDDYPQFKEGYIEMYKFISKNIIYPTDALRRSKGGKVVIRFVVDINGNVTKPTVYKSAGWGMDEEAIRVISIMPAWIPAKINGQNVACYFKVPIYFRAE